MADKEIQNAVDELIKLTIEQKEIKKKITELKQKLLLVTEKENLIETSWGGTQGGFVTIETKVKYELADLQPKIKIDESILSSKEVEMFVQPKLKLNRIGMKEFKNGRPELVKIMIPIKKKQIKLHI